MTEAKLIIVAGMSGTGKSTTTQNISYQYTKNGINHEWYHEEMKDHPIRWANGGEFTIGDLNTEDGMKLNIADTYVRWKSLVEYMLSKGGVFVMEGCLYQNIIRYFIPVAYPVEKIIDYYNELMEILKPVNLHIIHLYRPDVPASFEKAFKVRGKKWEHIITEGKEGFDFANESAYQTLAREIFYKYAGEKLCIDTSDDDWESYLRKICSFLCLDYYNKSYISVTEPEKYIGYFEYKDEKSKQSLNVIYEDGKIFCSPSWFTHIEMNATNENEFELSAFPIVFKYLFVDNDVYINVSGNYDWGLEGKTLKRIK